MRNYLAPRRLAEDATPARVAELREARRRSGPGTRLPSFEQAQEIAATLEKAELRFDVNAGPQGTLFGSVTPTDIADEIWKTLKIRVDRRKIDLRRADQADRPLHHPDRGLHGRAAEVKITGRPGGRRAAARGGARSARGGAARGRGRRGGGSRGSRAAPKKRSPRSRPRKKKPRPRSTTAEADAEAQQPSGDETAQASEEAEPEVVDPEASPVSAPSLLHRSLHTALDSGLKIPLRAEKTSMEAARGRGKLARIGGCRPPRVRTFVPLCLQRGVSALWTKPTRLGLYGLVLWRRGRYGTGERTRVRRTRTSRRRTSMPRSPSSAR